MEESPKIELLIAFIGAVLVWLSVEVLKGVVEVDPTQVLLVFLLAVIILFISFDVVFTGARS